MWFAFGFITLTVFSVVVAYARLVALWSGIPRGSDGTGRYEYRLEKHKGRSTRLFIGVAAPKSYDLALKRERGWDVLFKWLGLSEEFQTGNADFDATVYVVSDDRRIHQLLKSHQAVRSAVQRLIRDAKATYSFRELRCKSGRIWVRLKPEATFDDRDVESAAREIVPGLRAIADAMEASPFTRISLWRDPFVYRAAGILSLSTALALNGIAQWLRLRMFDGPITLDRTALFMDALGGGVATVFVLVVATVLLLGRSARTHLVLIELLLVGAAGAVATTAAELRDANMEFDGTPASEYVVLAEGKRTVHHRKGPDEFYLLVNDWREGHGYVKLEVSRELYRTARIGDRIRVYEKPGYFHYRWLERMEMADQDA